MATAKRESWTQCSLYIRLRDAIAYQNKHPKTPLGYVKCCTCDKIKWWRRGDAGHFIARGRSGGSGVYFDERNIHFQCKTCNGGFYAGTNIRAKVDEAYEEFMLETYGQGVIDELHWLHSHQSYKGKIIAVGVMYREMYRSLIAQHGEPAS